MPQSLAPAIFLLYFAKRPRSAADEVLTVKLDVTYIGVITSPLFGQAAAALPPRRTQLNLAYKF